MLTDVRVDLGTVALLAIVVWLDGWRRLPDGAVLVERFAFGPWTVSTPSIRLGRFALVAWWSPVVVPVLLQPEEAGAEPARGRWNEDFEIAVAERTSRLHSVRWDVRLLRALGLVLVLWLIAGIPIATALFGGEGLIHGVLDALGLALVITLITTASLMSLENRLAQSFRMAAQLLSPFTAPRAAEIVTSAAVGPLSSMAPVAALLGEPRFLAWVRPWAYDALEGRHDRERRGDETIATLVSTLPHHILEQAVRPAPRDAYDDGARYCPRCLRTYRDTVDTCGDCGALRLIALERGEQRLRIASAS